MKNKLKKLIRHNLNNEYKLNTIIIRKIRTSNHYFYTLNQVYLISFLTN